MEHETCYMCDKISTSREHVPPKCLFPQSKDFANKNFRNDLITVPSCPEHNSSKSKDDEFLMVCMAGIVGNNSIAYVHNYKKVGRAIRRSAGKLLNSALKNAKPVKVPTNNNQFIDALVGTPDHKRLTSCFVHIAYGVHFHHFGKRFIGQCYVHLNFLIHADENAKSFAAFIRHKSELELSGKAKHGKNSEVFYYQFTEPDENGIYLVHLCFYERSSVYVSFLPLGKDRPFELGWSLIEGGIQSTVNLEGQQYKFNTANKSNQS